MMNNTPRMDRGSRTEVDLDHMPLLLQALQHRALPGILAVTCLHRPRQLKHIQVVRSRGGAAYFKSVRITHRDGMARIHGV